HAGPAERGPALPLQRERRQGLPGSGGAREGDRRNRPVHARPQLSARGRYAGRYTAARVDLLRLKRTADAAPRPRRRRARAAAIAGPFLLQRGLVDLYVCPVPEAPRVSGQQLAPELIADLLADAGDRDRVGLGR